MGDLLSVSVRFIAERWKILDLLFMVLDPPSTSAGRIPSISGATPRRPSRGCSIIAGAPSGAALHLAFGSRKVVDSFTVGWGSTAGGFCGGCLSDHGALTAIGSRHGTAGPPSLRRIDHSRRWQPPQKRCAASLPALRQVSKSRRS